MSITSEIASGAGIYLAEAAKLFPRHRQNRPVSPSCLFRWATSGVRLDDGTRLRLEAARIAGKLVTSRGAIERFLQRQTPRAEGELPAIRTPTKRVREHTLAQKVLAEKHGI
jgi:hypothetical protein